MSFWSIPRIWPGETVAILGAGPSLDVQQVRACVRAGWKLIACNRSWELIPEWLRAGSWCHGCDLTFWAWYLFAREFPGIKTTLSPEVSAQGWGVHLLRDAGPDGFCDDPSAVTTGWNSGFQAIHIAAHTGASRVILLGLDMRPGSAHWHGPHPDGLPPQDWAAQVPLFHTLVEPLEARGVDVLNATPGSAIDAFPMVDLSDLIVF